MTGDLIGWIVGILAALLGVGGLYAKGRSDGRKREQERQDKITKEAEQQYRDRVKTANDARKRADAMSDADAERRLRDRYTRD